MADIGNEVSPWQHRSEICIIPTQEEGDWLVSTRFFLVSFPF